MHTLFFSVFIGMLFLPFSTSFLTAPISTLLNYTKQTIACWGQTDTLYNGTTTFQSGFDNSYTDYCIIVISTSLVNNLIQTTTYRTFISGWNMYRNMVIHQCNFSTTMDIGYGSCTPYYYQTAISIQICICPTNNCTTTYSTCQASVNQALSSPPPLLPVLIPSLTNTITCPDLGLNMSAANNTTPPMYSGCGNQLDIVPTNMSKCYTYTPNHTVMCAVYYDPIQGIYLQSAMIEGDYEPSMYQVMQILTAVALNTSNYYQYQTSTAMALIFPGGLRSTNTGWCFCTTNNCNVDFNTCTSGMNIPSYLLPYNGSTSSTPSQSTSSGAITSPSSAATVTIGATNSTSSSMITTLQISTATTRTTSITVSTNRIINNTTLHTSRTSSIFSTKYNQQLLVALFIIRIIIISSH